LKDKELRYLLTQNCNYDCVFCNREGFHKKSSTKMLSEDYTYLFTVFKDNFDWQEISLTGGEPLLYESFDILVKDIHNNQGIITVISNGELLDKHLDTIALLKRVNLSLHTLNEAKYNFLTNRIGKLPKVISNIKATKTNLPHVDVRLNVVLKKDINDELDDIKRLIDFANTNDCSIKFIELSNNKDILVPLDEVKVKIEILGFKERLQDKRKIIMSDNIILSRNSCNTAQKTEDPSDTCNKLMDFFITPSGTINLCSETDKEISILNEVKQRDNNMLIEKLKHISTCFGQNCNYQKEYIL